jgi:hypothetical protein
LHDKQTINKLRKIACASLFQTAAFAYITKLTEDDGFRLFAPQRRFVDFFQKPSKKKFLSHDSENSSASTQGQATHTVKSKVTATDKEKNFSFSKRLHCFHSKKVIKMLRSRFKENPSASAQGHAAQQLI